MIIVSLIGGLGNQLFQYAAGKNVVLKNSTDFKFDINGLKNHSGNGTPRTYALEIFNIQENFASEKEIEKLKGERFRLFKKNNYIIEPKFSFNSEILKVGKNTYLQGYWQSEKYFKNIEGVIRKELTLKDEFSIEDKEITRAIKNANAISLHIRRGDYVADVTTNKFHGICSLEYYANAIKYIVKKIKDPIFYIFSDDIEWVKQNLNIDFPVVYVSDGKLKDYEELMLMSYCQHNIIANSSFSWWGAWLNANPEKIVISPERWFADESVDTKDLIPETWLRL